MPDDEWVEMVHPKLGEESTAPDGNYARATRAAFDEVWSPLGWKEVKKSAAAKSEGS